MIQRMERLKLPAMLKWYLIISIVNGLIYDE